ncbi:hypothetical protein ACEWY4_008256 [Coilia grayii]|uniref:Tumor protein p53-inducible protein 13 n=1 Tax=Coilia grayii TaxID=363190 RepID=A0ABD1KB34_9TELE
MTLRVVILLTGLCWTCQSAKARQLCDNGKFQVELDLPHPSTLHCSEPLLKDFSQQVSIDQKYPPSQPVKHVCMDTPISYNATIPSREDHRPVGAEPGVYLYCPPQRWLNNLQHGSIVVLHHPCAPEEERSRLTVLALSCLPAFIMTAHPWLSRHRPLALVSWGRTLEMSHVTSPEVCDWLVSVSVESWQHSRPWRRRGERYYNLLLTHSAPLQRPKESPQDTHATSSRIDWLKSIRRCCERTLSSRDQNGDTQRTEETKRTEGREETNRLQRRGQGKQTQKRRRRAVLPARQGDQQDEPSTKLHPQLNSNNTDLHSTRPSHPNDTSTPSTGVLVETHHPAGAVLVGSTAEPKTVTAHISRPKEQHKQVLGTVTAHISPPKEQHKQVGAGEPKEGEGEVEEAPRTEKQGGHSSGGIGAAAAAAAAGGGGGGGGVQRKVTKSHSHSSHSHSHSQSGRKEKQGGGGGGGGAGSGRQRVREDTEEQERLGGLEGGTDAPAAAAAGGVGRMPMGGGRLAMATPRTDEAVWAAAALGFLLVLLTLSVLHTRLYRHWRTAPSLYWRDNTQDYDSVTDIIRRRLKLAGRRKRRVAAGRRHEAPLIPNSSTEEESD